MRRRSSNDWEQLIAIIQALGAAAARYPRVASVGGGALTGCGIAWVLHQLLM